MTGSIPEFGPLAPRAAYVLRPGGYAVIFGTAGEVALVSTPHGLALPGGGQNAGESPEDAAAREAREECGLQIALVRPVGVADELVFADDEGTHYRKRCTFFIAEAVSWTGAGEPDHELVWLALPDALAALRHESQRWAVARAARMAERSS
jgi:8-oxo-dGTP diphosphatase